MKFLSVFCHRIATRSCDKTHDYELRSSVSVFICSHLLEFCSCPTHALLLSVNAKICDHWMNEIY